MFACDLSRSSGSPQAVQVPAGNSKDLDVELQGSAAPPFEPLLQRHGILPRDWRSLALGGGAGDGPCPESPRHGNASRERVAEHGFSATRERTYLRHKSHTSTNPGDLWLSESSCPLDLGGERDLVREGGLEPPRLTPHAPQTCLSANSSTLAGGWVRTTAGSRRKDGTGAGGGI